MLAPKILLRDAHATRWALFRARLCHPLLQLLRTVHIEVAGGAPPRSRLITRQVLVVRRGVTPETMLAPTEVAPKTCVLSILEYNAIGTVRRGARPEVARSAHSLLQTPIQQPVEDARRQQCAQHRLGEGQATLGTGYIVRAHVEAGLGMLADAPGAVAAVATGEPHGTPRGLLLNADLTCRALPDMPGCRSGRRSLAGAGASRSLCTLGGGSLGPSVATRSIKSL